MKAPLYTVRINYRTINANDRLLTLSLNKSDKGNVLNWGTIDGTNDDAIDFKLLEDGINRLLRMCIEKHGEFPLKESKENDNAEN